MKQRVEEMEREANKLRELQAAAEQAERAGSEATGEDSQMETEEEKQAADSRSIYVGNVRLSTFSLYSVTETCIGGLFFNP